jgi:hypothetical protein
MAYFLTRAQVREQVELPVNDAGAESLCVDRARDCVETAGLLTLEVGMVLLVGFGLLTREVGKPWRPL